MLYSVQVSVLANTEEVNSTHTYVKINKGVINYIWVTFPPGCAGFVKFRMYVGGHPFLPVNKDAYIRGDNYTYQFPVYEEVEEAPGILTIEAWSEGSSYNHTLSFQILILPKWVVYPSLIISQAIEGLARVFA